MKDAFASFFPDGADIIVDATGVPEIIPEALGLAHRTPYSPLIDAPPVRYLIEGSYEGMFAIPYAAAYEAQLRILIPKGSQTNDWKAALELLSRKRLRIRDLISDVREPESASETYAELSDPQTKLITAAFKWK
jgi:threonine dehydrogenase-like Zn-dependent dehydrogenase